MDKIEINNNNNIEVAENGLESESNSDYADGDKIKEQKADILRGKNRSVLTVKKERKTPEFCDTDIHFIKKAMLLARQAEAEDEVPVGAIVVRDGEIIAEGYNRRENDKMATHHAEILAIEEACRVLGGWRLPGCTLYVTMEPCCMCAGAIINARIERVVFSAYDKRFGAFGSLINLGDCELNHHPIIVGGVLEEENRKILSEYFKKKRKSK